jgi:hypothetical protein
MGMTIAPKQTTDRAPGFDKNHKLESLWETIPPRVLEAS